MVRILARSTMVMALCCFLPPGARAAASLQLPAWLTTGSVFRVSADRSGTCRWTCGNATILGGQGTGSLCLQARAPGPLTVACQAPGFSAAGRSTVLPPPHAEPFAQRRIHIGERTAASLAVPFIRTWHWDGIPGAGASAVVSLEAGTAGSLRFTGTVEDLAGSRDTASCTVEVVQGDFASPGGVMAEAGAVTARFGHTATALADGTVLVAGGLEAGSSALASAERYDPAASAWIACGDLNAPRSGHTATLLASGQVLVVGGACDGVALASAELFDPRTGDWTVTGSLHSARSGHSAALVDGKVLVAGGSGPQGLLAGSELYDPATGAWSDAGTLDAPRSGHTATLLMDGATVLVFGGDPLQANPESWR